MASKQLFRVHCSVVLRRWSNRLMNSTSIFETKRIFSRVFRRRLLSQFLALESDNCKTSSKCDTWFTFTQRENVDSIEIVIVRDRRAKISFNFCSKNFKHFLIQPATACIHSFLIELNVIQLLGPSKPPLLELQPSHGSITKYKTSRNCHFIGSLFSTRARRSIKKWKSKCKHLLLNNIGV